jgi:hypothetical protein
MMFVVLCDIQDSGALWLVSRLRETGTACLLVTSELLSFARRRSQWIGREGTRAVIDLGAEGVIQDPVLVVNRLMSPPTAAWHWANAGERDYAGAELTAFVLSWLAGLPGVVRNQPAPTCLAGPSPHPLVAAIEAARSGFDVPNAAFRGDRGTLTLLEAAVRTAAPEGRIVHVVVLDGRIIDPEGVESLAGRRMPETFAESMALFAASVGASEALIGVDVVVAGERWWYAGMTPLPDLVVAGDAVVEALVGLVAGVLA